MLINKKTITLISLFFFSITAFGSILGENEIVVDGKTVASLEVAEKTMVDGSQIYLGKGTYNRGIVINKDNVTLVGSGSHFNKAILGKAAIVVSGDNVTIESISCSDIAVPDKNGACIRQQGKNLTLINVHFYDSEQGILQAANTGFLKIKYSVFERLGKNGQAHAVYAQGEELIIDSSQFLESKDQGHSIKSRAKYTKITNSIIVSQNSDDSRLIDLSSGGVLLVTDSILMQGSKTVNRDVIGYGFESIGRNRENRIIIRDNIILMERPQGNILVNQSLNIEIAESVIENNLLVGSFIDSKKYDALNFVYKDRKSARLDPNDLPTLEVLQAYKLGLVE